MIRTCCGPPPCRRRAGFTLTELLVALGILAALAAFALAAWARSQEASLLRQAQMQTAAVLRDAVLRGFQPVPAAAGGVQAQVIFTPGSGTLVEQVKTGSGAWQSVTPPPGGAGLQLPGGVTVQSTTWAGNTMQVMAGDVSTGTYEAYHSTTPGSVTLQSPHGMTATVHVTGAGTVWY
jgi:prepilin-type N-terminal cleavage/methylation domain-containing protein